MRDKYLYFNFIYENIEKCFVTNSKMSILDSERSDDSTYNAFFFFVCTRERFEIMLQFQTLRVVSYSKINLVGALGRSFFEFPNSFQKRREKQKKKIKKKREFLRKTNFRPNQCFYMVLRVENLIQEILKISISPQSSRATRKGEFAQSGFGRSDMKSKRKTVFINVMTIKLPKTDLTMINQPHNQLANYSLLNPFPSGNFFSDTAIAIPYKTLYVSSLKTTVNHLSRLYLYEYLNRAVKILSAN
ncbi:Uncharacterized protein FWK35_00005912 [Aphis craccivora]|uniref:Uncharacterized protein n=1 Tax=Aphis craccivora TaxID=307492 RepID=A0A6G0YW32_APHCR|nr:Uncharacterized protein FWK35_00005912 [Aphis craccivora]